MALYICSCQPSEIDARVQSAVALFNRFAEVVLAVLQNFSRGDTCSCQLAEHRGRAVRQPRQPGGRTFQARLQLVIPSVVRCRGLLGEALLISSFLQLFALGSRSHQQWSGDFLRFSFLEH
jgi:hypothetical protein